MLKYKLFDIQRNSFVDGPGIRTIVFFRGCNLKCEWCHNPEGQSGSKSILYYRDKCTKCGECIKACKQYDIKMMNSERHKKYTGVGNELILENLKKLFGRNADIWVIIPVITGVNDNKEEMQKIREYLEPYRPQKIKLLPYHRLGEGKYEALSIPHKKLFNTGKRENGGTGVNHEL